MSKSLREDSSQLYVAELVLRAWHWGAMGDI
jgi:hypothetical protein